MITITDKSLCCGCSACATRCPKACITMVEDSEGFLYPQVDASLCIDCGLCEKVCHELHPFEERKPLQVLAANNKDTDIRLISSSGGIFTILAEKTLSEGGVVFGARFDENWQVVLDYTETTEGLDAFRGSKYVQARTASAYKDCEQFLKSGRKVLFSGTPCQIAGLKHFLRKDYDNLTTVDFVCHGTPSPKVWKKYLEEVKQKAAVQAAAGKSSDLLSLKSTPVITGVNFREKSTGWKKFRFVLSLAEASAEGKKSADLSSIDYISDSFEDNPYMKVFLRDMILRPSCYNCQAKSNRSLSDITIADFWGVQNHHPEIDDDGGTSLVMANSVKGQEALDLTKVDYVESTYEKATEGNKALYESYNLHPHRRTFFKKLDKKRSVIKLMEQQLLPTRKERLNARIYGYKSRIYSIVKRIINRL